MRTITQREFRNSSAAVMDAVEAGETFHITRNGVEVAEVRPLTPRRSVATEALLARHRTMASVSLAELRADADAFHGDDDRL
jgi:antitoxin (DNA-binding transcriptional repressor) of toxin-antitoxin stability system